VSVKNGELRAEFGYVDSHPPRERSFARELEAELEKLAQYGKAPVKKAEIAPAPKAKKTEEAREPKEQVAKAHDQGSVTNAAATRQQDKASGNKAA